MQAELTKPRAVGPVTAAIRSMRAADPAFDQNAELRSLRRALAETIESYVDVLDVLGGDPDLEADYTRSDTQPDGTLALVGLSTDDEPSLCGIGGHEAFGHHHGYPQETWNCGSNLTDIEGTNEDGGDIQDEPHDAEEDDDRDSGCADAEGALEAFGGHTGHFAAYA